MKIKFFIFFLLCSLLFSTNIFAKTKSAKFQNNFLYSQETEKTLGSFQLIKDIQLNLEKGFYSLVIANANQLEKEHPNSKFIEQANRCKLEALYMLGRKQEASTLIEQLETHPDVDFIKGRIFFDKKDYLQAVISFYSCAKSLEKNSDFNERYFSSLYYSAKSYNLLAEYEKSLPILLSLIEKYGYSYNQGELTFLLAQNFYEEKNYLQVCSLYEKTSSIHSFLNEKYFRKILLMAASSFDAIGNSEKAKSLFTKISEEYDVENLGISEFWVKTGIESFNEDDFSDAMRCFDVAQSTESFNDTLKDTILLYNAAIKSKTEGYSSAVKFLEENSIQNKKYFYMMLCSYSALANDFNKSIFYGEKILQENIMLTKKEEQVFYWYGFSLFKLNKNKKALEVLNKISLPTLESKTLTAKINFSKSSADFSKLYEKEKKSQITFENSVLENLVLGKTEFLTKQKSNLKNNMYWNSLELKNYFLGLAYYLEEDWNSCIFYMDEHLKSSTEKKDFAQFYKAYSLFKLQDNETSFDLFLECAETLPNETKFKALFFASQCALALYNQNSETDFAKEWLDKSIQVSKNACDLDISENKKIDCLIYLCQLYSLSSDYEKAISLILPYSNKNNETALKCLYILADLYKKSNQLEKADQVYQQLASQWQNSQIAEESIFMQGQLFYENSRWGEACDKFSTYRKTYPNGKYYLQVCYYNGIALKKLGNDNLAILLLKECANTKNASEYSFISLVELMDIYRQKGDYENAVNTGLALLKNYPEQAKEKNIQKNIEEITYLASGESEKNASLLSVYSREGGMKTVQGRMAGFQLGQSYISTLSTKEEGFKLLQEFVLSVPNKSDTGPELENLAKAYYLLGSYFREKLQYKDASKNFLLAAQYFASFDKDFACRSLYGAVEAFDCDSSFADSKQTYLTMKEKYPTSQWTQRAFSLISE